MYRRALFVLVLASVMLTSTFVSAQISLPGTIIQKVRPFEPFDFYSAINCEEDSQRVEDNGAILHQHAQNIDASTGEAQGIYNNDWKKHGWLWCPVDINARYLGYDQKNAYGVRVWASDRNTDKDEGWYGCRLWASHGHERFLSNNVFEWESSATVFTGHSYPGNMAESGLWEGTTGGYPGSYYTDDPDALDMMIQGVYEFNWFVCVIPPRQKEMVTSTMLGYAYGSYGKVDPPKDDKSTDDGLF